MSEGIYAFASTLLTEGSRTRNIEINITKVENGYVFKLEGLKEIPLTPSGRVYRDWENFEKTFVYLDLQIGLNEIQSFFEMIETELAKQVKEVVKSIKKEKRGRKKKNGN